jgi:hypothetical protein
VCDYPDFKIAFLESNVADEGMDETPEKAKRAPSAAFMIPVTPEAYIRKNGLQDAKQRTLINADENLKAVFNGKEQVSMFEMTKLVSGHVKK